MKRKQFCCLILILVGVMSLGLAACEKKQSKTPSDPNLIVLDDYEIRYKGAAVMPISSCEMLQTPSSGIQYTQRRLHRSVTEIRT